MSQAIPPLNIDALDVGQRIELLGRVWDSLIDAGQLPPPPAWHAEEIQRRLERIRNNPGLTISVEQLRQEMHGDLP